MHFIIWIILIGYWDKTHFVIFGNGQVGNGKN